MQSKKTGLRLYTKKQRQASRFMMSQKGGSTPSYLRTPNTGRGAGPMLNLFRKLLP